MTQASSASFFSYDEFAEVLHRLQHLHGLLPVAEQLLALELPLYLALELPLYLALELPVDLRPYIWHSLPLYLAPGLPPRCVTRSARMLNAAFYF